MKVKSWWYFCKNDETGAEHNLFQGEFKNQPETAKEGGEKDEEGGDTFAKAAFFLRVSNQLLVIVIDGDGDILVMT